MNSPYQITPETWYYTCFYDFWMSGYCCVRLRKAAILDLSKMADTEGGQLGSLEKLPQRGLGRSPSRHRIWCILALKSAIW